jgi:hypothetical protein
MRKKVAVEGRKQDKNAPLALLGAMQQLVLPLVVGIEATKDGLLSFVHQMGMAALNELRAIDAAAIAGPKGKRIADRTAHPWGSTRTPLPFGGRHGTAPVTYGPRSRRALSRAASGVRLARARGPRPGSRVWRASRPGWLAESSGARVECGGAGRLGNSRHRGRWGAALGQPPGRASVPRPARRPGPGSSAWARPCQETAYLYTAPGCLDTRVASGGSRRSTAPGDRI